MKLKFHSLSVLLISFFITAQIFAQSKTENIVIVTLDGMRWQEVFGGADSSILRNSKYTKDFEGTSQKFWSANLEERRKKLFPFLWNTVAHYGQLHGNRKLDSKVNNANPYKFSYPGYSEIFTGFPDSSVNSNDKIKNNPMYCHILKRITNNIEKYSVFIKSNEIRETKRDLFQLD